jgi:ubiquinol-cytochrome c reductase iron-sulfur subunit
MAIATTPGASHGTGPGHSPGETRRDFLMLATGAVGTVAACAAIWPLLDQMNPAADTIAAGAPIEVDVSKIAPGQQIQVLWRGHPMFILHRTPEMLKLLQSKEMTDRLRDPNSANLQQPEYANNWHRSLKPEFAVLVGVCTHLGCIPALAEQPKSVSPDWLGGYFCHCHGSKYDFSGRVFKGVPAPYNLPVPPHNFVSDTKLRIGENPKGSTFSLRDIVQI